MPTDPALTLADILAAQQVIRGVGDGTPLVPSPFMAARTGHDFLLKLENTQPMGAFKLRGALNALAAVPLLMLVRNYDDHDRSDRYTARGKVHLRYHPAIRT